MKRDNSNNRVSSVKKPLVTVITTVLNRVDHIEQAMQSVLDQTYKNIEYVVIDAGSTDGTLDIVDRFIDNIKYCISEPDSGIYEGINKGLKLTGGDYIIILNADDYFLNDAVEILVDKVLVTGADIVAGSAIYLNHDDTFSRRVQSRWGPEVYLHAMLRHEAMLAAASAYRQLGCYDESKRVISDRLWMVKAYESNLKVEICDNDILYFRQTGISSVGENGLEIRFEEAVDYLASLDSSLTELDLFKLARPMQLKIEEIDYFINVCHSSKLRDALFSLLRWNQTILDRRLSLAWEALLSSKRWQIGCILAIFLPVVFEEREAIRQLEDLVLNYKTRSDTFIDRDETFNLELWMEEFRLNFDIFMQKSKRWKAGNFIVSKVNKIIGKDNDGNPAQMIKQYLAKSW